MLPHLLFDEAWFIAKAGPVLIDVKEPAKRDLVFFRRCVRRREFRAVEVDETGDDHALVERRLVLLMMVVREIQQALRNRRKLRPVAESPAGLPSLFGDDLAIAFGLFHQRQPTRYAGGLNLVSARWIDFSHHFVDPESLSVGNVSG